MIDAIVTCFNEETYIEEAILSIIKQTAFDKVNNIIVVDDGSTDQTTKKVEMLKKKYPKIVLLKKENGGISSARNHGLKYSNSTFIALLDGDDIWLPTKLEKQIAILKKYACDFVYSGFYTFSDQGIQSHKIMPRKHSGNGKNIVIDLYLQGGPIIPSTVIFRREICGNVLLFDEMLPQAEDTDYWLRYLQFGHIELCSNILMGRRIHQKSLSFDIEKHYSYQLPLIEKISVEIPYLLRYKKRRIVFILSKLFKRQIMELKLNLAFKTLYKLMRLLRH